MKIIKSYHTTGLCGTCYRELPATIEYRDDGAAYICKTCPEHGYEEYMVEIDWKYWDEAPQAGRDNDTHRLYGLVLCIDITDRCNVACKHCYHNPDNKIKDKPKEFIISKIVSSAYDHITLMGAEPTMREDLCEIISEVKQIAPQKMLTIYTNGVKLEDENYVRQLETAGLGTVNMSVHNPKYHKEQFWNKISKATENIIKTSMGIGQISFTVENIDEVRFAVEKILWFKSQGRPAGNFCIRSPADIGTTIDGREIFASEIAKWIEIVAKENNITFERHPNGGSNPYHIAYFLDGMIVQVIHWGGVKNIDTSYMNMGPWAEFIPNTFGTLHLQIVLREGWKRGWWQGQQLIPNSKPIEIINKKEIK